MGCNCQKTPTEQDVKKIAELDQYIDSLLAGTSDERRSGFLIQILHRAQSLFGFLSEETQKHVSEKLRIPVAEIYGVISFYSYFTDKPVGRYKINVCTGTACFVKGAAKVLEEFKRNLGIQEGETTGDGRFFLGGHDRFFILCGVFGVTHGTARQKGGCQSRRKDKTQDLFHVVTSLLILRFFKTVSCFFSIIAASLGVMWS